MKQQLQKKCSPTTKETFWVKIMYPTEQDLLQLNLEKIALETSTMSHYNELDWMKIR